MFRTPEIPIHAGRRRWLAAVPLFMVILIPLSMGAHDIRATFGAGAVMLAVDAVVVRLNGGSRIVQIALWVGAAGLVAAMCFSGAHLHH